MRWRPESPRVSRGGAASCPSPRVTTRPRTPPSNGKSRRPSQTRVAGNFPIARSTDSRMSHTTAASIEGEVVERPGAGPGALPEALYRKALLIRRFEERLLELFAKGQLFGTVHTCIGQEFTGLAIAE